MKKKIFSLVAIAAISFGAWNYSENQASVEVSDLALANVEALALGESGSGRSCFNNVTIAPNDGSLAISARKCSSACWVYWATAASDRGECPS